MPNDLSSPASIRGLSEADAQARLKTEGYNELPRPDRRTPLRIVLEVLREPMLALLLGGGVIYLVLGDLKEALILLAFATMSVVITVVQETRTERVLEALRDLTSPRALVIRDGERKRIAGREVVRGDLVVLAEGDRVPADAVLVESHDLQTDESLLTGESVPVRKIARGDVASLQQVVRPGGDDLPYVFSGSLVVRGTGIGEVIAIGALSEIGKIGQSLSTLETEPPRLQAQTRRLVRVFAMVGGAVSVLAVLLYGTLRGGWLDAVLAGIALGMSMLPEEFPVVLTVFMAMGAWRISRARVLTRRAAAIETLGSATVLCTDKTGTLTENRMSIAELRLKNGEVFRPRERVWREKCRRPSMTWSSSAFSPARETPSTRWRRRSTISAASSWPKPNICMAPNGSSCTLTGFAPISSPCRRSGRPRDDGQEFVIAAKGAPEAIADLCHLGAADLAALTQSVDAMAAEGLRVLGVARASFAGQAWPDSQHDFAFEFLGLVGLADPLRPSVPDAVSECRSAGIKVVMITGDYPATARAIARQAGLDAEDLVTGEELEQAERGRAGPARANRDGVRADHAGAEAPHRQRAQGERRDRGDDRRRRQRCALAQGGAHRHRHGRTRDRRGARGVVDRAARRRFRLDRQVGPARPPNLRQSPQGDGLHLRRPRADRGTGAAAAAVRLADPVRADAHRISGDGDRSGVFARLRGRDGGGRRDAPAAARPR